METLSRYLLTFLFNSLWQIPLIAAVAFVACKLMRNGPASHRHAVWVAALFVSILLPLASLRTCRRDAEAVFSAPNAPKLPAIRPGAATGTTNSFPLTARGTVLYARTTATILSALYLLFLVFRFAKLARAWMRTVEIRRGALTAVGPPVAMQVWDRCLRAFGLHEVLLCSSPHVTSPVAAGEWRKTIILPEPLLSSTNEDILTTAIGHEMAHLARHDFALNVLYELVSLPIAFHPVSWLIRRILDETREMACDELVTDRLLDAGVYAQSIVKIAAVMIALPQPGYTLGVFDRNTLEKRIRRLLDRPIVNPKRARLLLVGGLTAVALCAVIAAGIAVTARAQSSDLDSKLKALDPLMSELMRNPADAERRKQARQALLDILALDPANQRGLNGMMSVSISAGQPLEARQWALKMVTYYPKEKTSYYCLGFTDWSVVYPAVAAAREVAGMKPEDSAFIAGDMTRRALRDQYGPLIEEGIRMLETSVGIDPGYSDAMAYLNLLYRMKANVVETAVESAGATSKADEWIGKSIAARQAQPAPVPAVNAGNAAPPPPPPPPRISDDTPVTSASMPSPINGPDRPGSYWQVTGAGDTSAKALMEQLQARNFPARFVISGFDQQVRVMVGPFSDEASLAGARSRLESAGFHVIRAW